MLSSTGIKIRWSQSGSSAGLWNWARYGCLNASSAVIRFSGLNWRSFCNKSAAWWLARGKSSGVFFGFGGGRDSSIVTANGDCTATMSSFAGFPVTSIIRSSWFMVEVPGKMGFLETNISCEMRWLNYATPSKKLSQDATTWPCVNSKCVPRRTEKNLWRSIPVNQAIRH